MIHQIHDVKLGEIMSSNLMLKVLNSLPVPGRNTVIVGVEVLHGMPGIGCILSESSKGEKWEIVGFGHTPVSYQMKGYVDLLLSPINGQLSVETNAILSSVESGD
jgi:hypothetical protein